jgi:hypothetical protein
VIPKRDIENSRLISAAITKITQNPPPRFGGAAEVGLTGVKSGVSGRVHRLDQCMRKIPAKLFDYRALTLKAEVQTDLAGIFAINGEYR